MGLVLIIGINGVGKEHIRACNNLGLNYVLFDVDISDYIGKEKVINKWDKFEDIISLENLSKLASNWREVESLKNEITHSIICTPDNTHNYYSKLCRGFGWKVFCEKPYLGNYENVDYIGYHRKYDYRKHNNINFYVKTDKNRQWNSSIKEDLLGHIIYTHDNKEFVYLFEDDNCISIVFEDNRIVNIFRNDNCNYKIICDNEILNINYELLFLHNLERFIKGVSNVDICKKIEEKLK